METRSKTRVGQAPEPHPEPARGTPETPVLRSSSESSFNLTVLMDDWETGVVGPGRPTMRATSTSPQTTLADQPRDAAGIDPVHEPIYDSGSPFDDTVTERHRAVAAPAAARNPTIVIILRITAIRAFFGFYPRYGCYGNSLCSLKILLPSVNSPTRKTFLVMRKFPLFLAQD